jgi:hypothetical protein
MFHLLRPGNRMNNVEVSDAHKKLVWRYVETWRRWRRLPDGYRSFADLEDDLAKGYGMLLCGLLIEQQANHAITADIKDPKFFAAIFRDDDSAISDMTAEEVHQARRYIIHGKGKVPVRKWDADAQSVVPVTFRASAAPEVIR